MADSTQPLDSERPASGAPRAARHNPRHERNRVRLMDAAIDILLGEGLASFTSARIAEAAGLHKPAFYAHFKNVDECLEVIAIDILAGDIRRSIDLRTDLFADLPLNLSPRRAPPELRERLIDALHRELLAAQEHERIYRLSWRYRYSDSALGDAVRKLDRKTRDYWVECLWRLAVRYQIDAKHFHEVAELAEHIVGITYTAVTRLLDGRVDDLRAEAERVYRYSDVLISSEVRRMLRAQQA